MGITACGGDDKPVTPPQSPPSAQRSSYSGCKPPGAFLKNGPRDTRRVALTFDDTPSDTTLALARVLDEHGADATFFVVANQIGDRAGALRRLLADGSEIGNHSYSHANLVAEPDKRTAEIEKSNAAIEDATGFRPCLFRAPYGQLDPALVDQVVENEMTMVGWDVDPSDWQKPGVQEITKRVLAGVRPGSIVVMHDSPETGGQTLEALPAILEGLDRKGLKPVTVSKLLGGEMIEAGSTGG
ncbi:MAG: polysaccharide deacetylase family protein [Actinobacteria bacterium]|nr:polysaccharide deacetylase family protein [Actinomycetota bacterium]